MERDDQQAQWDRRVRDQRWRSGVDGSIVDLTKRLDRVEQGQAEALVILRKLSGAYNDELVAAKVHSDIRAARRQRWADIGSSFGLLGTIIAIVAAIAAFWKGWFGG